MVLNRKPQNYIVTVLTCTVFVGSFLLFCMEPFIGRKLTPLFGGSVHVWMICLAIYQLLLLTGYLYAHFAASQKGPLHILLLLFSLIVLLFGISIDAPPRSFPLLITFLAAGKFALPFVLLSATTIVIQIWLCNACSSEEPYSLYIASNAGALTALIAYPFLIEPFWGLRQQSILWTIACIFFVMMMILSYGVTRRTISGDAFITKSGPGVKGEDRPKAKRFIQWMLLSTVTSAFLVTVTNVITSDMGSFPLIWILPLGFYLISFMMTFRKDCRAASTLARIWPEILMVGFLFSFIGSAHFIFHLGRLFIFFAVCILIHRSVYEERPRSDFLSMFYIAIALGGAVGSMIVSLLSPLVFTALWEYPFLMAIVTILFFQRYGGVYLSFWRQSSRLGRTVRLIPMGLLAGMIMLVGGYGSAGDVKAVYRNYYGVSRVIDVPVTNDSETKVRSLVHGSTIHGVQFTGQNKKNEPTLYYHRGSGLADIFAVLPADARIAAIGLGVGTIGAYTRPGNRLDFYELNPQTEIIARRWFTYLNDARAQTRVIIDDGRLALNREAIRYDLIFVDAFSGEGIPTHLLTLEAINIYLNCLKEEGIILFHITNRYYDFRPVLKAAGTNLNIYGAMKSTQSMLEESEKPVRADYGVLTRSRSIVKDLAKQGWQNPERIEHIADCRVWTDDYINMLVPLMAK
jgi:hypothetical protein